MHEHRSAKDALKKCELNGNILPCTDIDIDIIKGLVELSKADQEAAKKLKQGLSQNSILWSNVYVSSYDALHKLVDTYLRFDKITSSNHLCLFAYLCEKHSELEFDWNFLEKIRTKRNGIQYYGTPVNYKDWKEIELQITLYINTIKKAIEKKLKNS